MKIQNLETGLFHANNLGNVHMSIRRHRHEPSWFGAFTHCLKVGDEESAELIRQRNTPRSDECDDHEHDSCNFKWCGCRCHAFELPPLESAPLRSCAEIESEQDEAEYLASIEREERLEVV